MSMHIFCCWILLLPCFCLQTMPLWAPVGRGHVAFWCFCFSLDIYPGVDLLDHSSRFGSLRNLRIVFHSSCAHLPSHQQAVTGLLSARAHTPHSRGTGASPSLDQPRGLAVSDQGWAAQHAWWTAPSQGGCSTRVIALPPSPPGQQTAASPPSLLVLCGSFLQPRLDKPFCSLPVTSQWDCSACRCVCVCGARGVLAWGFLLCHSSRNSSYKIFFFKLVEKNLSFLRIMSVLHKFRETKIKLFCRYSWLLPENRSCTYLFIAVYR